MLGTLCAHVCYALEMSEPLLPAHSEAHLLLTWGRLRAGLTQLSQSLVPRPPLQDSELFSLGVAQTPGCFSSLDNSNLELSSKPLPAGRSRAVAWLCSQREGAGRVLLQLRLQLPYLPSGRLGLHLKVHLSGSEHRGF